MLEVIGFIIWLIFTVMLTAYPFLMLALSRLGGGLDKTGKAFIISVFLAAIASWSHIFQSVNISLN